MKIITIILSLVALSSCSPIDIEGKACAILPNGNQTCVSSEKPSFEE